MAKSMVAPLEQTARLLDLVPFLLSHQGISLIDLAKHFKVDSDVMIDDLNTLDVWTSWIYAAGTDRSRL